MITLQDLYEGSTFHGAKVGIKDKNTGTYITLTGANVIIQFKRDGIIYQEYSTTAGTLMIIENRIIIPEHISTLLAGLYDFDINIIYANEKRATGVARGQWTILNPITKR